VSSLRLRAPVWWLANFRRNVMTPDRRWLLSCALGISVWNACVHDVAAPARRETAHDRAHGAPPPSPLEAAPVAPGDQENEAVAAAQTPTSALQPAPESKPASAARRARPAAAAERRSIGDMSGDGLGAMGFGVGGGGRAAPPRAKAALAVAPAEFNREAYEHIAESGFRPVRDEPLSTFSVDVDTASYSNVRRFLREGRLPPADAVRIEELVNYFDYTYPQPEQDAPFATYAEIGACPWNPAHQLVHIGIAGKKLDDARVPARNLVFLIDVSGSMQDPNKLPLLKQGMTLLAKSLRPEDRVSMVVYAGSSGLVLPATAGSEHARILDALARLEAGGSTNGAEGIELAYREAQRNFIQGGINRVILATDGDFNVGVTSEGELTRLIEEKRKSGVFLTVLGFGTGNLQDARMEQLADKGNGNYAYIDDLDEAHKVLVREAGATLVTIAKDVKLQVEFNPRHVQSYRLIGYENRALAARDFNDDKKDAGEIGAGHTVTALYEIVPRKAGEALASQVDALRYQGERGGAAVEASHELLTVKIRFKAPDGDTSHLLATPLRAPAGALGAGSTTFRFAAAVAEFGMLLRASPHRGQASFEQVRKLAESARGADPHGEKGQFLDMVRAGARLRSGG
jgi:Ca-activated chloride channel family protein